MFKQETLSSNAAPASPVAAIVLTGLLAAASGLSLAALGSGVNALLVPAAAMTAAVAVFRPEIGLALLFLSAPLETTYIDIGIRIKPQHILGMLTIAGWTLQSLSSKKRNIRGSILNLPLFLIVLMGLATFMLHSRFASLGMSLFALQLWFIAIIYLVANFADRPGTLSRCFWMLVIAGVLEAGFALVQSASFYRDAGASASYSSILQEGRPSGTFTEPDFLAPFLVGSFLLTLPFWESSARTGWGRLIVPAALLILAACMLTMVRAAWLGMLAGAIAFAWLKVSGRREPGRIASLLKRAAAVTAAIAAVIALLASVSPAAFSAMQVRAKNIVSIVEPENPHRTRLREVNETWETIKESPLTGHGIGTFGVTTAYGGRIAAGSDQLRGGVVGSGFLLGLLHDQGLVGLALFVLLVVFLLCRLFVALRNARPNEVPYLQALFLALVALTVSSAFNNLYYFGFYWLVIALAAGMASARPDLGAAPEEGDGC